MQPQEAVVWILSGGAMWEEHSGRSAGSAGVSKWPVPGTRRVLSMWRSSGKLSGINNYV